MNASSEAERNVEKTESEIPGGFRSSSIGTSLTPRSVVEAILAEIKMLRRPTKPGSRCRNPLAARWLKPFAKPKNLGCIEQIRN